MSDGRCASNEFLTSMVNYATTLGRDVSLHTGPPGANGLHQQGNRQPTFWGPVAVRAGSAESVGSECFFDVPGGVVCTHFGVWAGQRFLYGGPIVPSIEMDEEGGTIVFTPTYRQAAHG